MEAVFEKMSQMLFQGFKDEAERSGTVSVATAARVGISRKVLSNWAKTGKIQRVDCGAYQLPEAVPDDMALLVRPPRRIVFSHESALYLNGLSERCPAIHSVTVPSGAAIPRFGGVPLKAHYVRDEWFGVGLDTRTTPVGGSVPCYDAERTVCDILRSRSRVDEETLVDALRRYAASPAKDLNRHAGYARTFRVERLAHERLGVLL